MISEISINFAGEQLTLNQYRSIFWDKEKSLILSDLHLETHPHFTPEVAPSADVLILAGDIGSYQSGSMLLGQQEQAFRQHQR